MFPTKRDGDTQDQSVAQSRGSSLSEANQPIRFAGSVLGEEGFERVEKEEDRLRRLESAG